MSKHKHTKKDKKRSISFVPSRLRTKKIDPCINSDYRESLSKYLETEDPKYLFKAIKTDNKILQGEGDYLIYDNARDSEEISEFVNQYTIVWESIRYWQRIYRIEIARGTTESDLIAEDAKKLLWNVGKALIPDRLWYDNFPDGLMHITPDQKLWYQDATSFIKKFHNIRDTFKKNRSKARYGENDVLLKEDDVLGAIRQMDGLPTEDIDEFINSIDFDEYDLENNKTQTISYILWHHKFVCEYCKEKGLSFYTIEKLYEAARKESVEIMEDTI